MITNNRLLKRQLKKSNLENLDERNQEKLQKFLQLVEQSYEEYEADKKLYDRVARIASDEFQELNHNLQLKIEELKRSNEKIKNSIEYASLMQQAILPDLKILNDFCKESFIYWQPKDIVGGDVYFINVIEDILILMVIDGAGHGVSGAFLTMLVKAIEGQIIASIKSTHITPSPALILEHFNQCIKQMLRQEKGSFSNSGFDGGVLYYNKKTNVCKYAGAKTTLYVINDEELKTVKSDRKSVGFIRTKIDQKYTEQTIEIKGNTKLYITTDGILDQEGINDSRYGALRFKELILKNHHLPFEEQQQSIKESFLTFKGEFEQSDDITVVGLEFK